MVTGGIVTPSSRKKSRTRRTAKRRTFTVINPASGKGLASYPISTRLEVSDKVDKAREAFRSWSKLDPEERAVYLLHFAEILRKHKEDYARTMTLEMGKIIRESIADRKSTRLNSSHSRASRMPSSA